MESAGQAILAAERRDSEVLLRGLHWQIRERPSVPIGPSITHRQEPQFRQPQSAQQEACTNPHKEDYFCPPAWPEIFWRQVYSQAIPDSLPGLLLRGWHCPREADRTPA